MKQISLFNSVKIQSQLGQAFEEGEQEEQVAKPIENTKRTLQVFGRKRKRHAVDFTTGAPIFKRVKVTNRRASNRLGVPSLPRIFKCHLESCAKIFNDRASLKKHMTVHGDKLVSIHISESITFSSNAPLNFATNDSQIMRNSKDICSCILARSLINVRFATRSLVSTSI